MKIGLAQLNPTVGDLPGNVAKILAHYRQAILLGADVVLTPELSIPGYPPQDLVFKSRFVPANLEALTQLHAAVVPGTALVVGFVERNPGAGAPFFNSAALLAHGRAPVVVRKSLLPTYDVFDEARYFEPAAATGNATLIELAGRRAGLTICEDIWTENYLPRRLYEADPVGRLVAAGAELILNLSASPFQVGKPRVRAEMLAGLAARHGVPFAYCNAVGGNDELIFDGNSLAFDGSGRAITRAPGFAEYLDIFDLEAATVAELPPFLDEPAELHAALVLGLRDYLGKCGFKSAVLGLSGGIDSAVVACLAADALGPQNVLGVAMPSP
ncbi:MAG: NAD+ synthase, partial [Verrucomicrobia bacterium]|nr:NAD+ synthase [Verrucomicrobiota bacterium]